MNNHKPTPQLSDMPHEKRAALVKDVFSIVAPYIDPLDTAFSLGLCHLWRRRLVSGIKRGERVLDICTGTGEVARHLLKKIGSGGSLTCVDFSEDMLEIAKKKLSPLPQNLSFVVSDVRYMSLPENSFDAVTVAFGMRNVPDTPTALKKIISLLRPGGRFFCLELTKPKKRWFLPLYTFYTFTLMPLIARIITKSSVPYTYLPQSIDAYHRPEEFKGLLEECGFSNVRVKPLSLGIVTIYKAVK